MKNGNVTLRPLKSSDSALFYDWITDKELLLFNSAYRPVSETDHNEWFESMMRQRSDITLFVIEENVKHEAIGSCQLMHIDMLHRNAELQIRIGSRKSLSRGLGSEAILQLIDYGFNHLNLHRIYLHVFASNERAIKSYLKCGFSIEGTLREAAYINGKYLDIIIMGIIKMDNE